MEHEKSTDIRQYFQQLDDPRIERNKKHDLLDIIMITFIGLVCGVDGWESIEDNAEVRKPWLETFLKLPNGIPSHDTLRRVFARLDPKAFQACIFEWINAVRTRVGGEVVAIDGKTVRGSVDSEQGGKALHSVSAWATETRLVLGQCKTAEKSNEIVAIPELLDLIDVQGCIVTIDAMGCQTKIIERIVTKKGDYVIALKGNQPDLHENIAGFFEAGLAQSFRNMPHQYYRTVDKGHGRLEIRECWQTDDL